MFNQEQLAAIAAAMSVIQHSLQSNSPPQANANSNSNQNLANSAASLASEQSYQSNGLQYWDPLIGVDNNQLHHSSMVNNSRPMHNHLQQQHQEDVDFLSSSLIAGQYHQPLEQQHQSQQLQSQHQLHNQHQLNQKLLQHLDHQPQIQSIHQHQPIQQPHHTLHQQQQQPLFPSKQPHHHLLEQEPLQQQQPQPQHQQQPHHLHHQQQLHQNHNHNHQPIIAATKQHSPPQMQTPLTSKPTRPVSYSSIVAKSAGLFNNATVNNSSSQVNNNNNIINNNLISNNGHNSTNYITNNSHMNNNNNYTTNTNINANLNNNNSINTVNNINNAISINPLTNNMPTYGSATNLLGFMGLYVGNLSPDLTKEQLEKIFSKYGEPVKAHRLIRSPVAFIKYENTESPRAAIDDLHGLLLPELTLNQDQPLKLHFDRNDAQLKANYRPTELPPDADNGECYGWRTTVCRRGKNCPKKHIPINRGIDFQMWMIKSTPTSMT